MSAVLDRRWPRFLIPVQARLIMARGRDHSGLWYAFALVFTATAAIIIRGIR